GAGLSNVHRNHAVNGTKTGPKTGPKTGGSTSNGADAHGSDAGRGLGLIGMRERVTALGGRLQAGPRDGGGFQVRAEIPAETPAT
ncbi:MAG TPA: histidine kinase, partial [Streptosporangiaceae bacterium]|nr:histidine kinase [Streptosporangiaceae bacterium]